MFLPQNTILGQLEIIEVFEYYDVPRLFTCINRMKQYYFCVFVDYDNMGEYWYYLPVTYKRYLSILSDELSLNKGFHFSELGFIFSVYIRKDGEVKISELPSNNLDNNNLPDKAYLFHKNFSTQRIIDDYDLIYTASAVTKNCIDFGIKKSKYKKTEIDARTISSELYHLQNFVDTMGMSLEGINNLKGKIPEYLKEKTQLVVYDSFAASFGLRLKINDDIDMFGNSIGGDIIEIITEILSAKDEISKLSILLSALNPRAISAYRRFLQSFLMNDCSFHYKHASPNSKKINKIDYSSDDIDKVFQIVSRIELSNPINFIVQAVLIGYHLRTLSFEILVLVDNTTINGKIGKPDNPQLNHLTVNEIYFFKIQEYEEITVETGESKKKYLLIDANSNPYE